MTTIRISFRSEEAEAILTRLAGHTTNMPGLLKNLGETLLKVQRARFDTQTDPTGKAWTPLTNLTAKIRGADGPILRRTGRLLNSSAYDASGTTLRVGINTVDSAVHQFGATIKAKNFPTLGIPLGAAKDMEGAPGVKNGKLRLVRVKVPARPIVGFGPKDEQATRDTITDWLAISG